MRGTKDAHAVRARGARDARRKVNMSKRGWKTDKHNHKRKWGRISDGGIFAHRAPRVALRAIARHTRPRGMKKIQLWEDEEPWRVDCRYPLDGLSCMKKTLARPRVRLNKGTPMYYPRNECDYFPNEVYM